MFQLQLFFLLHCDEWDRVVALPRHKFVTGATLLQLGIPPKLLYFNRMCYGENGTVKFLETLADNVFRHNYSMMQI
jgi:hypothetical protein